MNKLEKIAYHEAGHVVASDLMNKSNKLVSIIGNETSLGRSIAPIFYENFNFDNFLIYKIGDYHEFFKAAVISLAGFVSEHIASGRRSYKGATGDNEIILKLAEHFELPDKLLQAIFNEAELYLRDVFEYPVIWELIKTLAETLLIKKELDQDEIAEIIENSTYYSLVHE
jgi:hypothetical protein